MVVRAFVLPAVWVPASSSVGAQSPPGRGGRGGGAAPGPPENLQVLQKTYTKQQVTAVMQAITQGLAVECRHCHVEGADGRNDFVSDAVAAKNVARAATAAQKGVPAALTQYRELKERFYGEQAYDFSQTGLVGVCVSSRRGWGPGASEK